MPAKKSKDTKTRVYTALYLDKEQHAALAKLSAATQVPMAAYFRQAVDIILANHGTKPPRKAK